MAVGTKEKAAGFLTCDRTMLEILERIKKLAASELPLILEGETGVGKELLLRFVHENSPRAGARCVVFDCGAFARELFASELFGYVKGAFTGANDDHTGLIEHADGGTLAMDEIGNLAIEHQVALLRVLETKVVRPVGSRQERVVDFRLCAATNSDLRQACEEGAFRKDLFHRLNGGTFVIPPLRERPDDILLIAEDFLSRQDRVPSLSDEAKALLREYHWPGNVRELRNLLQQAMVHADHALVIGREHLEHCSFSWKTEEPEDEDAESKDEAAADLSEIPDSEIRVLRIVIGEQPLEDVEKEIIRRLVQLNPGATKKEIAEMLGVSSQSFYSKLRRLKLQGLWD